jgi:hypothetical protein
MKKILIASAVVFLLLTSMVAPAQAIVFGALDGDAHPYVGSMVFKVELDGETNYFQWCSGTLIAPQVFLTASHCTVDVDLYLASYPGSEMLITFDPGISPSSNYYIVSEWVTNPAFLDPQKGFSDSGDVAVALLDTAPSGITPARLPAEGLLDQLKDDQVLNNTLFTAVGYGSVRNTIRGGMDLILDNLDRRRADQEFLSLTNAWLNLSMNPSTGSGGTCYGDSGGPHFIHMNGAETNIVVSVTVTGDTPCKALDKTYRVDTPAARAFLGQYVPLP